MTARKPQGKWTDTLVASEAIYTPARNIVIDLGSGSTALDRWDRLDYMTLELIRRYRQDLLYEYATVLSDWRRTLRWCVKNANHWIIELEPDEWQALSRGLRAVTGTPAYISMYQWLNLNKEWEDGD